MLNEQYEKWNRFRPLGFLIIGLGLSLTAHAIESKAKGRAWFIKSIVGLIVFNAGVAVFGEAIKARTLYEWELNKLKKS